MIIYTKKEKGNIGLTKAISEFVCQKIHVSIPIEEDLRYDLIVEFNGICKRVQCKYSDPKDGDVIEVKLESTWANSKGSHTIKRKEDDYDALTVYDPKNDKVYFIDMSDVENSSGIHLRLTPPKKKNQHTVRMAENYIDAKRIFS